VNGDGYDDFLIGAHLEDDGGVSAGQTYLILGKSSGWAMDTDLSTADASFWGENPSDFSGTQISGAGDVNGDGYDDVLIGVGSNDEGGNDAGQTYLIISDERQWDTIYARNMKAGDSLNVGNDLRFFGETIQALSPLYLDATKVNVLGGLTALGNVGIGTTVPGYALDVAGDINFTGELRLSTSAGTSGDLLVSQGDASSPIWQSMGTTLDGTYFKDGGNSFGALATLGTNDAYGLAFETGGTTAMTIDTNGNVGIGTTAPLANLEAQDILTKVLTLSPGTTLTSDVGFDRALNLTSGIATDGRTRLTMAGDLVNIGTIQAGQTHLKYGTGFETKVDYSTAAGPYHGSTGDFNGDGWADVAVITTLGGLDVFLNDGDGTFAAAANYSGNGYAADTGDVNSDGYPDIVALAANNAEVFLNNGDGTFAAKVSYGVGSASYSRGINLGDVNRDGKLDVVTANLFDDTVSVLINVGDGTFNTKVDYDTGNEPDALEMADFNGDGHLDIAVTNDGADDDVSILLNNGDGTFAARVDYAVNTNPYEINIADFDHVNGPDIVTVGLVASGKISVLLNNGDGTFAARVDYDTATFPRGVAVGDFNGDGYMDVAAKSQSTTDLSVNLNNGDGTFGTATAYTTNSTTGMDVTSADFNNDGLDDLASPHYGPNSMSVLMATPGSMFFADASSGNVGIGTTAPSYPLDIYTDTTDYAMRIVQDSDNGEGLWIDTDGNTDLEPALRVSNSTGDILWVGTSGSGEVGIGTTAPMAKLDVYGTGPAIFRSGAESTAKIWSDYNDNADADAYILFGNGINTGTDPEYSWSVGSDANDSDKFKIGYKALAWGSPGDSDLFTIDTSGNVGIGTTAPASALHVAGGNITLENGEIIDNSVDNAIKLTNGSVDFALLSNNNTFLGYDMANSFTTGSNNVAIGEQALYSTGATGNESENVAIGYQAMYNSNGADSNVAVGPYAMYGAGSGISGYQNVAVGYGAMYGLTSGYQNVALGMYASTDLTTGLDNVTLGYYSGRYQTTGNNNILIGREAGRGTSASTAANNNTIIGYQAGYNLNSSDVGNVYLGYQAGYNETGSNKLYIENSNANPNNALIYGDFSADEITLNASVGIGTTNPGLALDVVGSARFSAVGSGTYNADLNLTSDGTLTTASSDVSLKENLTTLASPLDKVMQLSPYTFNWIDDPDRTDVGLVAQEVAEIIPEITFTNPVDGLMGINYSRLPAVLVGAMQEQQGQILDLGSQVLDSRSLITQKSDEITNLVNDFVSVSSESSSLFETEEELNTYLDTYLTEHNDSEKVAELESRIAFLEENQSLDWQGQALSDETGSPESLVDDSLDLTNLNVLGSTMLGDTTITGTLDVGLIKIDGVENTVNAIGTLYLQRSNLSGIDFLDGLVTFEQNGDVVITGGVIRGNDNFRGVVELQSDTNSIVVEQLWEGEPITIVATPRSDISVWIDERSADGFTIKTSSPVAENVQVDWIAIW
ncbi:FG-GAP-like repeat-containing protein, partial [Patescibacteria group bacterium]